MDAKKPDAREIVKRLVAKSDVLIDPFRPGKMEQLGLGPKECTGLNEQLIYARITGYGQSGPMKDFAGHDINYLAMSGILSLIGPAKQPPYAPPLLFADFASGGLLCAMGICMALIERSRSNQGQVIDSSMVDGVSYLTSFQRLTRDSQAGQLIWPRPRKRGSNLLDGGAPFYSVYKTKDGGYMAVGALEPQFFANVLRILEIGRLWVAMRERERDECYND